MSISSELYANRMRQLRPSTIREILKVAAQPEIISFAGGLPAPELFPVAAVRAAADKVLTTQGREALQYGPSEGFPALREWIATEMKSRGINTAAAADVLVTNGSQQVLDLVAKLFINPGDVVLTENPTYLAAIQAFQSLEARFVPVARQFIQDSLTKKIIIVGYQYIGGSNTYDNLIILDSLGNNVNRYYTTTGIIKEIIQQKINISWLLVEFGQVMIHGLIFLNLMLLHQIKKFGKFFLSANQSWLIILIV